MSTSRAKTTSARSFRIRRLSRFIVCFSKRSERRSEFGMHEQNTMVSKNQVAIFLTRIASESDFSLYYGSLFAACLQSVFGTSSDIFSCSSLCEVVNIGEMCNFRNEILLEFLINLIFIWFFLSFKVGMQLLLRNSWNSKYSPNTGLEMISRKLMSCGMVPRIVALLFLRRFPHVRLFSDIAGGPNERTETDFVELWTMCYTTRQKFFDDTDENGLFELAQK